MQSSVDRWDAGRVISFSTLLTTASSWSLVRAGATFPPGILGKWFNLSAEVDDADPETHFLFHLKDDGDSVVTEQDVVYLSTWNSQKIAEWSTKGTVWTALLRKIAEKLPAQVHSLMDAVRATFPPGKRRRSCAEGTTATVVADKAETGKSPPADRETVVGIPAMAAASQRIETSAGYSSSFDLGMTQPGSLTTWRLSAERARQPAEAACQLQPAPDPAAVAIATDHIQVTAVDSSSGSS